MLDEFYESDRAFFFMNQERIQDDFWRDQFDRISVLTLRIRTDRPEQTV